MFIEMDFTPRWTRRDDYIYGSICLLMLCMIGAVYL